MVRLYNIATDAPITVTGDSEIDVDRLLDHMIVAIDVPSRTLWIRRACPDKHMMSLLLRVMPMLDDLRESITLSHEFHLRECHCSCASELAHIRNGIAEAIGRWGEIKDDD